MIKLYLLLSICSGQGCNLDRPMVDMDRVFKTVEQCEAAAKQVEASMQAEPDAVPGWHTKCIMGWKRPT